MLPEYIESGQYTGRGIYSLGGKYAMSLSIRCMINITLIPGFATLETIYPPTCDLSGYYQGDEVNYGDFNGRWRGGFNISNMGPKVELVVGGTESFIPTNLKLGLLAIKGAWKTFPLIPKETNAVFIIIQI